MTTEPKKSEKSDEPLLSPYSINEPVTQAQADEAAKKFEAAAKKGAEKAEGKPGDNATAHHEAKPAKEEHHEPPHVGRPGARR